MRTMTCKQLGGACEKQFHAETFLEIADQAKRHGMGMMKDPSHMEAMKKMHAIMMDPSALRVWMASKEKEFNSLPDK